MSVAFAHPAAALVALAGLLPLAVAWSRARVARRTRGELGLGAPRLRSSVVRPALVACAFGLLGLALAEPLLAHRQARPVRSDAQLLVALDSSRSMLAAPPTGQPRYARAAAFARRLAGELPGVPAGVASFSNRLLPYLFPTADARAYDEVVAQAYGVQHPPPAPELDLNVTSFDALAAAAHGFFAPTARRRILVVLSDAETQPFDAGGVLRRLQQARITPVVVRFWRADERIVRADGTAEAYRPERPGALLALRRAGWSAYPEEQAGTAVSRIRQELGSGPTAASGAAVEQTSIAPAVALAALAPLLLALVPPALVPLRRRAAA